MEGDQAVGLASHRLGEVRLRIEHAADGRVGEELYTSDAVEAPGDCFAYLRRSKDDLVLVALNFGPEERSVRVPAGASVVPLVSTAPGPTNAPGTGSVRLRKHEGRILHLA